MDGDVSSDEFSTLFCAPYIAIYIRLAQLMDHQIAAHLRVDGPQRIEIIRWLSQLCRVYRLSIDTLSTAVYVLDRYASVHRPAIGRLQLLAGCCLLIAAKYEERYSPAVSELVFLCDGLYSREDFIATESDVLAAIQFRVTRIGGRFVGRLKIFGCDVSPDFCEAIDFVARAALLSPVLSFANPERVAGAIIDVVVNTAETADDFAEKEIKGELLDVLDESSQVFD
jgi:hypothetical protein